MIVSEIWVLSGQEFISKEICFPVYTVRIFEWRGRTRLLRRDEIALNIFSIAEPVEDDLIDLIKKTRKFLNDYKKKKKRWREHQELCQIKYLTRKWLPSLCEVSCFYLGKSLNFYSIFFFSFFIQSGNW